MEHHIADQLKKAFGTSDLYKILSISSTATHEEIKKAYKTLALKNHPDKGGDAEHFKAISVAHCILSDPEKRKVYDKTGNVDDAGEEDLGGSKRDWYEYYRELFPPITISMIDSFSAKYKNSDEERKDILDVSTYLFCSRIHLFLLTIFATISTIPF